MALPVLESWQVSKTATTATTLSVAVAAGIQEDELVVIICSNDDNSNTTQFTITGWNKLLEVGDAGSDCHTALFWKVATASESAVTLNSADTCEIVAHYLRYSNADITTPFHKEISTSGGSAGTHAVTGLTTTIDDCALLSAIGFDGGDGIPFSVDNSYTIIDEDNVGTSQGACQAFATRTLATQGAMGTTTWTSNVNDGSSRFQVAIAPSTNVSVISDYDTISLTDYDSLINVKKGVTSDFDTISITDFDSVVVLVQNITSDFDTISITDYDSEINVKKEITSDFDTLSVSSHESIVNAKRNVTSDFDTISITDFDSVVVLVQNIISDFDTISITDYASEINVKKEVTSDFDTISITDYDSPVVLVRSITSDFDTLSITSYDSEINVKKEITSDFDIIAITSHDSVMTGNYLKAIISDHQTITITPHDSVVRWVIPGIFQISGQIVFKGKWTTGEY